MRYQDYLGWYNTLYEKFRRKPEKHEREDITDDIVFEMELVKQVQINIHYILQLIQQYHDKNCEDKEIIVKIRKQMDASPDMRDKRDLIEKFIEKMNPQKGADVGNEWERFIEQEKRSMLQSIINEEHLKQIETEAFMRRSFMDGYVTETGTGIAKILPPTNPFLPESGEKKQTVIDKLKAFLSKFLNTSDSYLPKLVDVEDDTELCNHIKTRLHMDGNISDGDLQIEVQKRFGERYPGMSNNDWRHIIEAYTPMVREASKPKAKEIPLDYPMAAEDE
jgi:type I restriction enzyme R subunit